MSWKYDDDGVVVSISEVIAKRASIDIQTMIENMLPREIQFLEKHVEELSDCLQKAERLDEERCAEIVKLEACTIEVQTRCVSEHALIKDLYSKLDSAKRSIVLLQDERNVALSKVKEQEACIIELETKYTNEYATVCSLHDGLHLAKCTTAIVQDKWDEALSEVKNLEKQISEFLFADYSDYSRLAKDSSKEITDLHARIDKLQIRLSNCAHWSNPMIYANPVNALVLIHDEASDAR